MGEHGGVYRTGAGGRVSFHPIQPDDAAFLYEVYASMRLDELVVVAWDKAHTATFLYRQCAAQHQCSQERYTRTDCLIMLRDAVEGHLPLLAEGHGVIEDGWREG